MSSGAAAQLTCMPPLQCFSLKTKWNKDAIEKKKWFLCVSLVLNVSPYTPPMVKEGGGEGAGGRVVQHNTTPRWFSSSLLKSQVAWCLSWDQEVVSLIHGFFANVFETLVHSEEPFHMTLNKKCCSRSIAATMWQHAAGQQMAVNLWN